MKNISILIISFSVYFLFLIIFTISFLLPIIILGKNFVGYESLNSFSNFSIFSIILFKTSFFCLLYIKIIPLNLDKLFSILFLSIMDISYFISSLLWGFEFPSLTSKNVFIINKFPVSSIPNKRNRYSLIFFLSFLFSLMSFSLLSLLLFSFSSKSWESSLYKKFSIFWLSFIKYLNF